MILINRCYSIVTPESAEQGDFAETGTLAKCEAVSFRELVRLLEEHSQPSCYPVSADTHTWFSDYGDLDYETGEETTESVHYARENPRRNEKYWTMAVKYVFRGKP